MLSINDESDLYELGSAVRLAAVIAAWSSRGLFEELERRGPVLLDELTGDRRALGATARILGHAGLLVRHGDRWGLSGAARKLAGEETLRGGRGMKMFEDLGQLGELLDEGGPVVDEDGQKKGTSIGVTPDDPENSRGFLKMLYRRSETSARETARWLDGIVDAPGRILDLGGGHGRYGRELAELGHEATLFDLPICVDLARELHGEDLDYLEGDFFVDDLGGPYDVILASNIVHGLSMDKNQELISRASQALAPGGRVVLKDMFLDEFGLWPLRAVYFGITMLMYTDDGDSYSLEAAREWFDAAGLQWCEPVVFDGFSLVMGRRV